MNKIKQFTLATLLILGTTSTITVNAQSENPQGTQTIKIKKAKHNIVMQLTSADVKVHNGLTKQLNNLKDGWGQDVSIEVVCHGPGIDFMRSSTTAFAQEIEALKQRGVIFVVCENSLKERKVDKSEILPGNEFVRMGIGEIVLKQEKEWTYIKAGF